MIGDILQLTIGQRLFDDLIQNVLYYRTDVEPGGDAEEEDLVAGFLGNVILSWQDSVTDKLEFDCIQAQKVFPDPVRNSFDTFLNLSGNGTGTPLPGRNCGLIQKFNPAVTGKGRKGRVYISGIDELAEVQGRLTVAQKVLLEDLAESLSEQVIGPDSGIYEPVWVTRQPTAPFGITGFVDWTNSLVKPIMASQKRRVTPVNSFVP